MIKIRKLDGKRWKEYRDIRLEALKEEPLAYGSSDVEEKKFDRSEWVKMIGDNAFAIDDGKIAGVLTVKFNSTVKHSHILNLYGLYVRKEYRGKGIASALFDYAIAEGRKNRILKVELGVNPRQKPAMNLYRKYGFKVIGKFRKELKINGRYNDIYIMEKFI